MTNEVRIDVVGDDKTSGMWASVVAKAKSAGATVADSFRQSNREGMGRGGRDGASEFVAGFRAQFGPLMAKAPLSPPILAGLAMGMPAVSALVSTAISGGAAAGAVGIGAVIAASTKEGEAALGSFKTQVAGTFQGAAGPMVGPFIAALDQVEGQVRDLGPAFRDIFTDAARYTPIFTRAVNSAMNEATGDFREIVDNAEPVVEAFGEHIPKAVAATGDALRIMSGDAEGSAAAFDTTMTLLEGTIRLTGGSMRILQESLKVTSGAFMASVNQIDDWVSSTDEATPATEKLSEAFGSTVKNAGAFVGETRTLLELMDDLGDEYATAFDAQTKFGEAMSEVTVKAAHQGAGINEMTKRGRENRDMLSELASATRDAASDLEEMGGSQNEVNGIMNKGYARFMAVADAMGLDAEKARALAQRLGLIPKSTTTTHKSNSAAAKAEADRVRNKLEQIERTYFARVQVRYYEAGARSGSLGAVGQRGMASGGISGASGGHAAEGGPRGNEVLAGEYGPELISLPFGSTVHTAGATQRMLAGRSSGGWSAGGGDYGVPEVMVSAKRGAEGELTRALLAVLRFEVRGPAGRGSVRTLLQQDPATP